jgi:4-nitrophenyl phosphatase
MDVPATHIMTSALATRQHLQQVAPRSSRLFVVGMSGLQEALLGDGYFRVDTHTPEFVVVGLDLDFTYYKGRAAARAILGGATFVGTNGDALRPAEEGVEPEAGAILAFLEIATGIAPIIVGKPGPLMFEMALERLGVHPGESLVVGDNLHTDVAGAKAAGIDSVLVMNGVTSAHALAAHPQKPTWAISSLEELLCSWHAVGRVVRSA